MGTVLLFARMAGSQRLLAAAGSTLGINVRRRSGLTILGCVAEVTLGDVNAGHAWSSAQ